MRKLIKNAEWYKYFNTVEDIRATRVFQGKRMLLKNLEWWKIHINTVNSGQTLFSGQAQVAHKSWMIKHINTVKDIRATRVFPGTCKSLKNPLCWKIYFQHSEFRANLVFKARGICSKILNYKKYIFNTVNSMQVLHSGQAQVAQTSWMIKRYQNSETFQSNSCFSG